jgi:hypothetical protein
LGIVVAQSARSVNFNVKIINAGAENLAADKSKT